MLFGKRKQVVKRILIVEDEPLTAFDNENILGDAGYEIVATVDEFDEALEILEREEVDLILSDVRLRSQQTGIELAHAAKEKGIPTLFATGHAYPGAAEIAVGCLLQAVYRAPVVKAIECVDRHLQGEKVKPPKGLELFIVSRRQGIARTVHRGARQRRETCLRFHASSRGGDSGRRSDPRDGSCSRRRWRRARRRPCSPSASRRACRSRC